MSVEFTVIIPARFASSRLPGKPLADICGRPMILHVLEQARLSGAKRVIVATDHHEVKKVVENAGGEVCLTSEKHHSGTERLAEVIEKTQMADDEIIVNIQGDEPLIPPCIVSQVANNLEKNKVNMASLVVPLDGSQELFNPNIVKAVINQQGLAMYFSRAPIPWERDKFYFNQRDYSLIQQLYYRHIGIYAYRAGFIRQYVHWKPSQLEEVEALEQLRVLWYGEPIHLEIALEKPAIGVDTQEDLEAVRKILAEK